MQKTRKPQLLKPYSCIECDKLFWCSTLIASCMFYTLNNWIENILDWYQINRKSMTWISKCVFHIYPTVKSVVIENNTQEMID